MRLFASDDQLLESKEGRELIASLAAQIGKQHGWPPPEVTEARARAIAELKDWHTRIGY